MKDRLKQFRKARGLKQRDIAEKLGVDVSNVGGWESGRNTIPKTRIYQLCNEYDVNQTWLETGEGEMFKPEREEPDVDEIKRMFVKSVIQKLDDDQRQIIFDAVLEEAQRENQEAKKK